jgi:hypothetical protein
VPKRELAVLAAVDEDSEVARWTLVHLPGFVGEPARRKRTEKGVNTRASPGKSRFVLGVVQARQKEDCEAERGLRGEEIRAT